MCCCHSGLSQADQDVLTGEVCLHGFFPKLYSPWLQYGWARGQKTSEGRLQSNVPFVLAATLQHHKENLREIYCCKASFRTLTSAEMEITFNHVLWSESMFQNVLIFWSGHPLSQPIIYKQKAKPPMVKLQWLQQYKLKNPSQNGLLWRKCGICYTWGGQWQPCKPSVTHRSVCTYLCSAIQLPVVQRAALSCTTHPTH